VVFWGNLCKAKATFFSVVSLINERTEVHSVEDQRAEPHLRHTAVQRASSPFPLATSDVTLEGGRKRTGGHKGHNTITTAMTMTFKCLTSDLFFAVKIKQQVISFTMSHYAPVVQ